MDSAHLKLAELGLRVAGRYGFALARGYAVQAHGILSRPSEDVDLFTLRTSPSPENRPATGGSPPRLRDGSETMPGMALTTAGPVAVPAQPHNRIRIGYARVSTRGQDHQAQLDALAGAHCREIVVETVSTRGDRPKLRATLDRL